MELITAVAALLLAASLFRPAKQRGRTVSPAGRTTHQGAPLDERNE